MTPEVALPVQERVTSWVPVPDSDTDCGLPLALSAMVKVAVMLPEAAGVIRTAMLQLPPAASEEPQVLASLKSAALVLPSEMPVMLRAAVPVLLRVTV